MLNPMPENAASACRLPDPQERVEVLVANCAWCGQPIYSCDEEAFQVEGGEFFCGDSCRTAYDRKHGNITMVCGMEAR